MPVLEEDGGVTGDQRERRGLGEGAEPGPAAQLDERLDVLSARRPDGSHHCLASRFLNGWIERRRPLKGGANVR